MAASERELILAKREGFVAALTLYLKGPLSGPDGWKERSARERYPLPPRMVPNVQTDAYGWSWRLRDSKIEFRNPNPGEWKPLTLEVEESTRLALAAVLTTPLVPETED